MSVLEHVGFAEGDVDPFQFATAAGFCVDLHASACVGVEHRPVDRAVVLRFALDVLGEDVRADTLVAVLTFDGVDVFTVVVDPDPAVEVPHVTYRGQVSNLQATGDHVELDLLAHDASFRARRVTVTVETYGAS